MKRRILPVLLCLFLAVSGAQASERIERDDLNRLFDGFTGSFVLYDEAADRYTVINEAQSEIRRTPCSTFKIFHALIGLDAGVLDRDDAKTLMRWDGKPSSVAVWNRDQTLASAMRNSVVWYFRRVAAAIGERRMQRALDRIGYGNRDISGGLTGFWLQSSLKISPREQVDLLHALYAGSLPFEPGDVEIIKRNLTLSRDANVWFMGKTGSGTDDADRWIIGWFVGCADVGGNRRFFAVNIEGPDGATGAQARRIAEAALRELRVLP